MQRSGEEEEERRRGLAINQIHVKSTSNGVHMDVACATSACATRSDSGVQRRTDVDDERKQAEKVDEVQKFRR